jgi:biotin-dependent carboxylase-like uncharacterized protein
VIEVIRAGLLTTIQDLGRHGYAHLGVTGSGALDRPALIRANRLVGNADGAAGLETTLSGVSLRAEVSTAVAVTGAIASVTVDGVAVARDERVPVAAGSRVDIGPAVLGVRSYVAFAGGITVVPVLGSRSTDTLSGLGPPPLRNGHVLPLGRSSPAGSVAPPAFSPTDGTAPVAPPAFAADTPVPPQEIGVRLWWGPRQDWFNVAARDALLTHPYSVSVKSNRVGARLTGPDLPRAIHGELPSEAIVAGAIQVPADGQPLVFLADHPTTGGYPVIAVVHPADLPLLAQARPGTTLRFVDIRDSERENTWI